MKRKNENFCKRPDYEKPTELVEGIDYMDTQWNGYSDYWKEEKELKYLKIS